VKFFLNRDLFIEEDNPLNMIIGQEGIGRMSVADQHEQARLVMADLEDIMYSAVVRAISDCFSEK